MANEDRFKLLVKQTLAGRVGYLCSAPRCGQSTIGPKQSERGALILGEAAHITAVSEGGPRFDRMLTSEQRRSESNGIWLCRHHARIIDVDPGNYPVEMLHEWKDRAERSQALALDPTGTAADAPTSSSTIKYLQHRLAAYQDDMPSARVIPGFPLHLAVFRKQRLRKVPGTGTGEGRNGLLGVEDLIDQNGNPRQRVVLLEGETGFGKSTFTTFIDDLLLRRAVDRLGQGDDHSGVLVPVRIELPQTNGDLRQSLENGIEATLGPRLYQHIVANGGPDGIRLALLIDGLDQDARFIARDGEYLSTISARAWVGFVLVTGRPGSTSALLPRLRGLVRHRARVKARKPFEPWLLEMQSLSDEQCDELIGALSRCSDRGDLPIAMRHARASLKDSAHEPPNSPLALLTLARLLVNQPAGEIQAPIGWAALAQDMYVTWLSEEQTRFDDQHPGTGAAMCRTLDDRLGEAAVFYLTRSTRSIPEQTVATLRPGGEDPSEWMEHLQRGGILYCYDEISRVWRFTHAAIAEYICARHFMRTSQTSAQPWTNILAALVTDDNPEERASDFAELPPVALAWASVQRVIISLLPEPARGELIDQLADLADGASLPSTANNRAWHALLWLCCVTSGTSSQRVLDRARHVLIQAAIPEHHTCALCNQPTYQLQLSSDDGAGDDPRALALLVESNPEDRGGICQQCSDGHPERDPELSRAASYLLRVADRGDEGPLIAAAAAACASPHDGLVYGSLASMLIGHEVWTTAAATRLELLAERSFVAPRIAIELGDDDVSEQLLARCPRTSDQLLALSLPPFALQFGERAFAMAKSKRPAVWAFARRRALILRAMGLDQDDLDRVADPVDLSRPLIHGLGPWECVMDSLRVHRWTFHQPGRPPRHVEPGSEEAGLLNKVCRDSSFPWATRVFAALLPVISDGDLIDIGSALSILLEQPIPEVVPSGPVYAFSGPTTEWLRLGPMRLPIPHAENLPQTDVPPQIPFEIWHHQLTFASAFSEWDIRSPTPRLVAAGIFDQEQDNAVARLARAAYELHEAIERESATQVEASLEHLVQVRNAQPMNIDTLIGERAIAVAGWSRYASQCKRVLRSQRPVHMIDLLTRPTGWPLVDVVWSPEAHRLHPNVPLHDPWIQWREKSSWQIV